MSAMFVWVGKEADDVIVIGRVVSAEWSLSLIWFGPFLLYKYCITNSELIIQKYFFLTRELSLINTCYWRADHEILMHEGGAGVH